MVWREPKTREMEPLGTSTIASDHRTVGLLIRSLALAVFHQAALFRPISHALPSFPFSSHFVNYTTAYVSVSSDFFTF